MLCSTKQTPICLPSPPLSLKLNSASIAPLLIRLDYLKMSFILNLEVQARRIINNMVKKLNLVTMLLKKCNLVLF